MLSCDAPLMMLEGLINNNNSGVPCERDLHLARELGDHGNSLMDRCDLSLGDVLTHQLSYDIVDVFLHDSYSNLIHVDSSGRGIDVNDDSLEEFGSFHFKEVVAPKEPNHDRLVPESFGNDHGHRERKTTVETVLPREENHNIVMVENCEKIHGHSMGAHLHLHELSKGSSMNMASQRVMFMGESSKSTIGEDVREGHALIDIPLPSNASSKDKGKGFDSQSFNFISPNVQGHINGDKEVLVEEKDEVVMDAPNQVARDHSSLLQNDMVLNGDASDIYVKESLTNVNELLTVQIEGLEADDCDGNAIIIDNSLREILEVAESDGNDEGGKFSEMPSSIDGEHNCIQEGEDAGDMVSLQDKCLPQIPYTGDSMDSVDAITIDIVKSPRSQQN
ncbi:hypothetical protein AMTR_s00173p00058630 [Amborella trichopoda]|uniref:Uncharacterized protein n=1 Tax=Amborella trichopoda TaxID=13333 RepID=W1NNV0_AMBTC|nr:hypothetical protein AMTR_s00173p00058630 [Amborella trichopoda]